MSATYPLQYSCYELLVFDLPFCRYPGQAFQASLGVVFCVGVENKSIQWRTWDSLEFQSSNVGKSHMCAHT